MSTYAEVTSTVRYVLAQSSILLFKCKDTMSQSTTSAIFSTYEILEAILLEVDAITLLTSAQRISRFWNNLIKSSENLQIAMFLAPSRENHPEDTDTRQPQ
ncbi:hypothetical protein BJX70DRAFT_395112 [Aspergillus crustosus]